MRSLVLLIVLTIYWWLLSGQTSVFLIGSGVVCILFTLFVCSRLKIIDVESVPLQAFFGVLTFFPWLMWQVFLSNIHVARVVWSPDLEVKPQLIRVPHKLKTGFGVTTYANSITLTPGTVTVDVTDEEMLVHALTDATAADLQSGAMHDRIEKMEGHAPPVHVPEVGGGKV